MRTPNVALAIAAISLLASGSAQADPAVVTDAPEALLAQAHQAQRDMRVSAILGIDMGAMRAASWLHRGSQLAPGVPLPKGVSALAVDVTRRLTAAAIVDYRVVVRGLLLGSGTVEDLVVKNSTGRVIAGLTDGVGAWTLNRRAFKLASPPLVALARTTFMVSMQTVGEALQYSVPTYATMCVTGPTAYPPRPAGRYGVRPAVVGGLQVTCSPRLRRTLACGYARTCGPRRSTRASKILALWGELTDRGRA